MKSDNIWMNDCSSGGVNAYCVMRGHEVYDYFDSTRPLTWKEQDDIIEGYREALAHYYRTEEE